MGWNFSENKKNDPYSDRFFTYTLIHYSAENTSNCFLYVVFSIDKYFLY